MTTESATRIEVAACIACGTRFCGGDCPDGCADVPLSASSARRQPIRSRRDDGVR